MRITQKTIFNNLMRDVNKNRSEMANLESDLSSGVRVRVPSRDPVSFQSSRIIKSNIRKNKQYQKNIDSGLRQSKMAQDALSGMVDNLMKVKETLVQGSNDSYGANERKNMADEISGIRKDLVSSLNRNYGNRFLFAGTKSDAKPFQLSGSTVTNNSNNKPPKIVAGDGVKINISVTGKEITNIKGQQLFTLLGNMEKALRNNNPQNVNSLISKSDDMIDHVSKLASKLGDSINRMNFMNQQYDSTKITQKSNVSELIDTDYADAFSKLQRNRVAYKSAMAVHSKMFENTLLNYI